MEFSEAEVKELEKKLKEPLFKKVWEEYQGILSSPYYKTYYALKFQLDSWAQQLTDTPVDLFGTKDEKEFDRVHKYYTSLKEYYGSLEFLKTKLTPEEVKEEQDASTPYEKAMQKAKLMQ